MDARKIPVTRVTRGGASGTPDEFDSHFARQHKKPADRPSPQPKLEPIKNKTMSERMAEIGIEES